MQPNESSMVLPLFHNSGEEDQSNIGSSATWNARIKKKTKYKVGGVPNNVAGESVAMVYSV